MPAGREEEYLDPTSPNYNPELAIALAQRKAMAPPPVGAVPGSVPGAAPAPPMAPPPQARGAGAFTPEERAYWLEHMPNITEQEEQLTRMRGLSESLRGQSAPQRGRMDWASQASRALSGVGSGLAHKRGMEMGTGLGNQLRFFAQNMPGSTRRKELEAITGTMDDPRYG